MVKKIADMNENKKKEIQTRDTRIWFDKERGIVRAVYSQGSEETLEDAEANLAAMAEISGGEKWPIFINSGNHRSMSRDARMYYIKNAPQLTTAIAVFVTSPFAKVLASFLLSLNKSINNNKFPVKFFNSEEQALIWLRNFSE